MKRPQRQLIMVLLAMAATLAAGAESALAPAARPTADYAHKDVLKPGEWARVDRAIDRALAMIASQQQSDGSFPTTLNGQPGVTALCVLAFMARGHLPGEGRYGQALDDALRFILSCQGSGGLIAQAGKPATGEDYASRTGMYNHAISGVVLCEAYGMMDARTNARIRVAIDAALDFSYKMQRTPKRNPSDIGGWRYLHRRSADDSDLSVTSWQLMFLRAAKNAGFDVPRGPIEEAMAYVHRQFLRSSGTFTYTPVSRTPMYRRSRAMAGAGILSLSLGGEHDSSVAKAAGRWILKRGMFGTYNGGRSSFDRYHYGAYYCSLAMFQLGGRYWEEFYPRLAKVLLANQSRDGSWAPESAAGDAQYGAVYTTALTIQALAAPYQLLPIYQR